MKITCIDLGPDTVPMLARELASPGVSAEGEIAYRTVRNGHSRFVNRLIASPLNVAMHGTSVPCLNPDGASIC